jgi:hypothetical protein
MFLLHLRRNSSFIKNVQLPAGFYDIRHKCPRILSGYHLHF